MFKPSFEMTDTMVPVLSREQIEQIAIDILKDFNPDLLENPQPLDIDRFRRDLGNVAEAYQEVLHRMMGVG